MKRRVVAPAGHGIAASRGKNDEGPMSVFPARDSRHKAVAINGARLVPWRPLQPSQAGFESPTLHFEPHFYYNVLIGELQ